MEPAASQDTEADPSTGRSLSPVVSNLVGIAAVVVGIAGLRMAPSLIGSVLLAVLLTVAVLPIGQWANRHHWPGWAATLLTVFAGFALLIFVVGGVALSVTQLIGVLPRYSPRVQQLTNEVLADLSRWGVDSDSAKGALAKFNLGTAVSVLRSVLGQVLHYLTTFFFLAVLLLFMTVDGLGITRRGAELRAASPRAARVLRDFAHGTQRYLVVSALFGAIVAVLETIGLWVLGVPLPLTWGLLSFLTNFIPNIGFVLGVVPPALLALLEGGWQRMVAVVILYCVLNVVIQTVIQPRYVGDTVGLNPTTTFLALAFWGFALGPLGALLAVPATLFVRALFVDEQPRTRWVSIIIGSPPRQSAEPEP